MRLVAFIIERTTIVRTHQQLGDATDPPAAAIRDPPEAARERRAGKTRLPAQAVPGCSAEAGLCY